MLQIVEVQLSDKPSDVLRWLGEDGESMYGVQGIALVETEGEQEVVELHIRMSGDKCSELSDKMCQGLLDEAECDEDEGLDNWLNEVAL
jgi:hypothetical protein